MSSEQTRNRDLFLKFCFIYFLNHILIVLGIDEEVVDVLPGEEINFKLLSKQKVFNSFFGFQGFDEIRQDSDFRIQKACSSQGRHETGLRLLFG